MPLPLAPIERTLDSFEKAAQEYHSLKRSRTKNSPAEQNKIDRELKNRLSDLDERRRCLHIDTDLHDKIAKMQSDLALYQSNNRVDLSQDSQTLDAHVDNLKLEGHHKKPLYGTLKDNMLAIGDIAPDKNCSCHHIVMGKGRSIVNRKTNQKEQSQAAIQARMTLHYLGLGINDPANGVYLPSYMKYVPHWRFPRALPHANLHTLAYEIRVNDAIRTLNDEASLRGQLKKIRRKLENGDMRYVLTAKSEAKFLEKIA